MPFPLPSMWKNTFMASVETNWRRIIRKITSRLLIIITTLVQGVSNLRWEGFVFLLCQCRTEYWYFQHRNHVVSRVPSYDPVSEVEDMGANLYFCCL